MPRGTRTRYGILASCTSSSSYAIRYTGCESSARRDLLRPLRCKALHTLFWWSFYMNAQLPSKHLVRCLQLDRTMWSRMALRRVFVVALTSSSCRHACAFTASCSGSTRPRTLRLFSTITDTPVVLPEFGTKQAYLDFLEGVSSLPKGFATGTAKGTFVSKEAPAMGNLPISGTVIHLTEGPTENWAAVFTKNKVRQRSSRDLRIKRYLYVSCPHTPGFVSRCSFLARPLRWVVRDWHRAGHYTL